MKKLFLLIALLIPFGFSFDTNNVSNTTFYISNHECIFDNVSTNTFCWNITANNSLINITKNQAVQTIDGAVISWKPYQYNETFALRAGQATSHTETGINFSALNPILVVNLTANSTYLNDTMFFSCSYGAAQASCPSQYHPPTNQSLTFAQNVTDAYSNTTYLCPAFPAINQALNLTSGQIWSPSDTRYNLSISVESSTLCQIGEDVTLAEGEIKFWPQADITCRAGFVNMGYFWNLTGGQSRDDTSHNIHVSCDAEKQMVTTTANLLWTLAPNETKTDAASNSSATCGSIACAVCPVASTGDAGYWQTIATSLNISYLQCNNTLAQKPVVASTNAANQSNDGPDWGMILIVVGVIYVVIQYGKQRTTAPLAKILSPSDTQNALKVAMQERKEKLVNEGTKGEN